MRDLPPALPPAERTVGQLIAETIRAYGSHFWIALPLGIPVTVADQLSVHQTLAAQLAIYWILTPVFVAAYLWGCRLVLGAQPTWIALGLGILIWLPFPALRSLYILPALGWFAFMGLAVPASMVERLGFRSALERGRSLGTADYVHALGSLAALVVVVGVSANALTALLHSQGDSTQRIGLGLSDVVLSPMLFLGGALLYVDQAARVGSRRPTPRRRRDADLHPPVDPDTAGRPDA